MNDNAIKNYAVWARRELMAEVAKRCAWWGISEGAPSDIDSIDGRVLSARERKQRADLLRIVRTDGYDQLVEKAAYTWFNRLLAIRFMEVNDRLPSHVRMLSSTSGEFEPQCLREALDLQLGALDKDEAVKLVQAGDDEALFRLVFLAQCAELAECMPAVFEPVGSAMELLLPTGLLRKDGIVGKLVSDIPEDDWREGVEIVGWMYQYYVSERKDEVFASFKKGKKAERDAIAPATQLFTPHWIVRYLTENSLGRLWMLNHPDSKLVERMPYFIKPDEEHETEFRRVSSPEEITYVDPACGSGHILVYAFELLAAMYEEAGYSNRDAARLIVEKNLTGLEIDPRAAAMASFALTMKACELDSRFLRRGVAPRVTVLERIEFEPDELALCPNVAERTALLDAIAHLDECGSLLQPTQDDIDTIARDLASLARDSSLFAGLAADKLERLQGELGPLVERYDVVVTNPPYMGGSNMDKWVSGWVKKTYPDSKRDLCTCFIERGFFMLNPQGYSAMVTMESWMFLGSFEKMRKRILEEHSVATLVYMNHMVMRIAFNTSATVFRNQHSDAPGIYTQVYFEDLDESGTPISFPSRRKGIAALGGEKREGYLEALANPECGWFYRANASAFAAIPGSPVAYWVNDSILRSFKYDTPLSSIAQPRQGFATSDNGRFLRSWWEVAIKKVGFGIPSRPIAKESSYKWFPCNKGGGYRRWYGNNEILANWENDGQEMLEYAASLYGSPTRTVKNIPYYFREGITWGAISSAALSMRYSPTGYVFETKGAMCFAENRETLLYCLALTNSSVARELLKILCPTLDFHEGPMGRIPVRVSCVDEVSVIAELTIRLAKSDWNSLEVSWDFEKHPLV